MYPIEVEIVSRPCFFIERLIWQKRKLLQKNLLF